MQTEEMQGVPEKEEEEMQEDVRRVQGATAVAIGAATQPTSVR